MDIDIGKRVHVVQIPPRSLESGSEEVDALVDQFNTITLDVNEFPTYVLSRLHKTMIQELFDHEAIVYDHLAKSQKQVATTNEEIKRMREAYDT